MTPHPDGHLDNHTDSHTDGDTDEVDVLVVGSGVAGLSTALGLAATRRVLVLTAGQGSTVWAQGGIAAAFGGDDPHGHLRDTQTAGAGLCATRTTRLLVEEGPQRVAELIALGARLDRDPDGNLARGLEGGHRYPRVVHAGGDATGAELHRCLLAAARTAGIRITSGRAVGLLTTHDGQVCGALVAHDDRVRQVRARAVVLATGGIGTAFQTSTNPAVIRGDGIALALHAGATVVDMEFIQFHPTALHTGASHGQLPLITEALRGAGATLRDHTGRAIMTGRHPLGDLAPRDIVARAIDTVMRRDHTEHVWLDATHLSADTLRRFPTVQHTCSGIGIDPASDPIPVAPAEHFLCGGIRVDASGATDIPGLYAVGEAAATGVHGANRLASNSLLEGLVYGRRTATALILHLPRVTDHDVTLRPMPDDPHPEQIRAILTQYAGIRRDATGLSTALNELARLDAGPLTTTARAILTAAATRQESRGSHCRTDHPAPDPHQNHHITIRLDHTGHPRVAHG